jgi:predicted nucleic acid-binding protein
MKNIVIDLNILMDFLFKRDGHEKAAELFTLCTTGKVKGFICAHEITTLFYFLSKAVKDRKKIKKAISQIMNQFVIIEINAQLLKLALSSEIHDFEDAVVEVSSSEKNADFIVTKNLKDFSKSIVPAITPEELLAIIKRNKP